MGERGLGIRSGVLKQAWEQTDFPVVCENCLGDNPYIRMVKTPNNQECRICTRPFTVFRWKPGTHGRWKRCEICQTCAKLKNACQACVTDLSFALPIEIRDKLLDEEERVTMPQEQANLDYMVDQANKHIDKLRLPYLSQGRKLVEKAEQIASLETGAKELKKKLELVEHKFGEKSANEEFKGENEIKPELLLPATSMQGKKPRPPNIPPPDIMASSKESEKQTLKEIIMKSGEDLYPSMDKDSTGGLRHFRKNI